MKEPTITIEDCLGENGFRVQYSCTVGYCDLIVWEMLGTELSPIKGRVLFQRKDSETSPDAVYTTEEAERYLEGSIKWDGCSDLNFSPDNNGHFHWCGPYDIRKHFALLEHIYRRAQELLPNGNYQPWGDDNEP